MKRLSGFLSRLQRLANRDIGRLPSFGSAAAVVSVVALLSLSYLVGAAAMYFRWPTSVSLTKAFMGAQDWVVPEKESSVAADPFHLKPPTIALDHKEKACNGYTLCMTRIGRLEATLRDMEGNVVHQWKMDNHATWLRAPHVNEPLPEERVHWDNCRVYPDGSLLALCAASSQPYGYGLVKLDKDSHVLWAYSANVHHDFDIGDDGRIYVLTQHIESKAPPELPGSPHQFYAEDLVILSPEGQPLRTISLYEAFRDSDFAMLYSTQLWRNSGYIPSAAAVEYTEHIPPLEGVLPGDVVHANSVKVLPQELAARFPQFKPGWVLVSFRSSSILAMIDPETGHVAWAAIGPWQAQHDVQFLNNGHLLFYDNLGSPHGARVLEYDPLSQAIPWSWNSEESTQPIIMPFRGACQRLPNGNTLVVVPERSVFEVTAGKETIWELSVQGLVVARRYTPDQVSFLPNSTLPRTE
jgi:hypothetical protein